MIIDPTIADQSLAEYTRDGLLYRPGFLDTQTRIAPLQAQIREIIDLARDEAGLGPSEGDAFDAGMPELLATDRGLVGKVYDAVRKLPGFFAIAADPKLVALVGTLMETDLPGFYAVGSGIRMDNPGEDQYLSPWHQEYPTHLNSLDMLTVWIPLVPVDETVGSVILCPGSHAEGIMPIHLHDPLNARRNGAASTEIADVEQYVERYAPTSIDTTPGDLVAIHGLTLHRSRPNRSPRTRWSMQLRFFNFRDPTARSIRWSGGMLAGVDLRDVHPEVVIEGQPA